MLNDAFPPGLLETFQAEFDTINESHREDADCFWLEQAFAYVDSSEELNPQEKAEASGLQMQLYMVARTGNRTLLQQTAEEILVDVENPSIALKKIVDMTELSLHALICAMSGRRPEYDLLSS